jgi:hypothetical protein
MTTVTITVTITRRRDPLEGEQVAVLRRWRRKHGGMDLLVVLPNGRKRLIPQWWTDYAGTDVSEDDPGHLNAAAARLGTVEDLSAAVLLVAALSQRARAEQAASQSTSEENNDAACPAQSAVDRVPDATADRAGRTARSRRERGDHAAGTSDRQSGRRGRGVHR